MRFSRLPAAALMLALTSLPLAALAQEAALITVTGENTAQSAPDLATIDLGVTTEGPSAAEALATNTAAVKAIMDRLAAAGIEARDIQTSNLSLNPNWTSTPDGAGSVISGYMAMNMLSVRVRDLGKLGTVLDAVVTDGANTLNGITLGLQDPKPVLTAARKEAVADARTRAEELAAAAGVTLGRLVSITEGSGYMAPQPMYRQSAAQDAAVPVAGGEVGMTASVTLVFEAK
jgi:uncharacterized protein